MNNQTRILIIVAFFNCALIFAQELPPVQNFSPKEYKAQNQNWEISQSAENLIYIANNKGLLEFNGARWKLYPTPNESIMRSVKAVDDLVFTGCYMDFGYWKKDEFSNLSYTSITKKLGLQLIEDEQFWDIINSDDWMIFRSLNRIYFYNIKDDSIKIIESVNTISAIYKVENDIYFQRLNEGIFKIEKGRDILINDDPIVKENIVVNIFKQDNNLLFQTRNFGFYFLKDSGLKKWEIQSNNLLSQVSVYNSIQLQDGSYILGTISNGIIQIDADGRLILELNQNNGLYNNTVLSLFEDVDRNIWLGLDIGISNINIESPFKIYNDNKGLLGSIYASATYKNKLYLGTNHGLFYKDLRENEDFILTQGTEGQVWCLFEFNNTLFCGHDSGTFIVDNGKVAKISNIQGAWDIKSIRNDNKLLLQGNYDGLYILERDKNVWKIRNKIEGFNISSKDFEFISENEIFINHEYKGIYKIEVDSNFSKVLFASIDTISKGSNSGIIKYGNDILYSYKNGVFKYDIKGEKFNKDSTLSAVYNEKDYSSGKLVKDSTEDILWNFSNSSINYITKGNLSGTPKINIIPLSQSIRESIVGYENVLHLSNQNYLIGNAKGYIIVDLNKFKSEDFKTNISHIYKSEIKKFDTKDFVDIDSEGEFSSNEKNIEIFYYVPKYSKYIDIQYQYQLIGIYDEWSDWSYNSNEVFENLPHGNYTFNVRAKNGNKISDNIGSYSFNIAKPWYVSNILIVIYILVFLLIYLFIHNIYKRYYKKQKMNLLNKKDQEHKLLQVEKEKEIIELKNEQLERENISKSRELATSTMNIIKKNEILNKIKSELIQLKNSKLLNPVIKIINNNLNHNDDWELFYEAFNNIDKEFLQKVKEKHPDLTPNDLRLCAYLRLNLSSKEIAPLLNISYKSVEIKRYRLRKKMNLSAKENLTRYILDI